MSPLAHNVTAITMATAYMQLNHISWGRGFSSLPKFIMPNSIGVVDHTFFITLVALGMVLGARGPDRLEIPSFNRRTKIRRSVIPHRTLTHWPPFWFVATLLCWLLWRQSTDIFIFSVSSVGLGFCSSGWLHLAMDIMTPSGIPLVSPFGSRTSFNLYKSGHAGEWLCVGVFLVSTQLFRLLPF
jgi:inner membrane protein